VAHVGWRRSTTAAGQAMVWKKFDIDGALVASVGVKVVAA
jgi:hypothetical protein